MPNTQTCVQTNRGTSRNTSTTITTPATNYTVSTSRTTTFATSQNTTTTFNTTTTWATSRTTQVKLLLNQRQDRLQLLVLRQLLGILVELQLLIQVLQHLKILLLRLIQVHPQQRHSILQQRIVQQLHIILVPVPQPHSIQPPHSILLPHITQPPHLILLPHIILVPVLPPRLIRQLLLIPPRHLKQVN